MRLSLKSYCGLVQHQTNKLSSLTDYRLSLYDLIANYAVAQSSAQPVLAAKQTALIGTKLILPPSVRAVPRVNFMSFVTTSRSKHTIFHIFIRKPSWYTFYACAFDSMGVPREKSSGHGKALVGQ